MDLRDHLTTQNLTATIAVYGALLSTFNFIRDRRKDVLKVEVSSRREFVESKELYIINVFNKSFFKIEIESIGFAVFPDPNQKKASFFIRPNNKPEVKPELPMEVETKRLFKGSIETELINRQILELGYVGRIKLQPYALINDKRFLGQVVYFNAINR